MPADPQRETPETTRRSTLQVWDAVNLLVGIVVGTAIFKTPADVFRNVPDAPTGLLVWGLGAVFALSGALCYCELVTTYPRFGAEYVYLSRAYGQRTGFLFAWMQMCVILTGSIGAMAFVFADYSGAIHQLPEESAAFANPLIASSAIALLTLLHLGGVHVGKTIQNFLSVTKIAALAGILLIGMLSAGHPGAVTESTVSREVNYGLALVFVLYAYGGWNDAAMVTPEVENHQENMPRALLIGLGMIAVLYVSLNYAFYRVLGFEGLCNSEVPATDVVERTIGYRASVVMSLVVMCSALGAIHGMLFSSSRLLSAIGEDYTIFARWNVWSQRGTPAVAIMTVAFISLVLVQAVGTEYGRSLTVSMATGIGLPKPDWDQYFGGFQTLVAATAPIFWFFFGLVGFAVMILRKTDGQRHRPFRVPWYPIPPLVFLASSLFMLWKSLDYAKELTLLSLPVFVLGLILSWTPHTSRDPNVSPD